MKRERERKSRGCSTRVAKIRSLSLSQGAARVFHWPGRSYLRSARGTQSGKSISRNYHIITTGWILRTECRLGLNVPLSVPQVPPSPPSPPFSPASNLNLGERVNSRDTTAARV